MATAVLHLPRSNNSIMASIETPSPLKPAADAAQHIERVAADTLLGAHAAEMAAVSQERVATEESSIDNDNNNTTDDQDLKPEINDLEPHLPCNDIEPLSSVGGSKDDPIDIDDSPPTGTAEQPRRPKGRSHGDKSNKHIRDLRTAATKGNIEAALKLGWSVERLTALYNRHKAGRGVPTTEDEPIDDPELLARIEQRKEHGREATKRRTDKLKARAASGDLEAAKKLGLGKRTMEALFPNLTKDSHVPEPFAHRYTRGQSPSEPRDFLDHQTASFSNNAVADRVKAIVETQAGIRRHRQSSEFDAQQPTGSALPAFSPPAFHGHPQDTAGATWGNMRNWEQMYPMPPPQFQIEIQLQTAYDEAKRLASIANQRVVDLGDKLKRYRDYQERFGVAMYEAMTKAADKLSVRDKHGGGRGMAQPIPAWTMMSDGAKMQE